MTDDKNVKFGIIWELIVGDGCYILCMPDISKKLKATGESVNASWNLPMCKEKNPDASQ